MDRFSNVFERRKTRSVKWDMMEMIYQVEDASEILPMWVADMDFAAPDAVIDALKQRIDHPIFGYSYVCDGCKEAISNWLDKRHGWKTETEWMLFHHGVVPAIASVVETFTEKGDRVLITPPVYPPFFAVPERQGRVVVESPLIEQNGHYKIDVNDFEEKLKEGVKIFILCNPHNPGGTVWEEEQLLEIIRLCAKYDVLILSDEIHSDLVFPEHRHVPIAKLAGEDAERIITCVAPTKTFNLAGIQAATMIVTDEGKRLKLTENAMAHGQMELNAFAAAAVQAAYESGEPWLEELLSILSSNMDYAIQEITKAIPEITIQKPQATYLLWIDYRKTGLSESEAMDRLLTIGKVALEPGSKYGKSGEGFLRMNVACPPDTLKEGVHRFIKAFK
ncbi:MalY/PatB family protein [Chungangia koreensis]|uniref:cysteine-S-conjugate beta-lyase n=1 Tax=Chungangia koreensis TaxID=752657 RepID=A0ABV8X616_9LACT